MSVLTISSFSFLHRQKLRRLEVAVVEYRESLEERGLRNAEEIDKKVAVYRRQLESDFGLSDTTDDIGSKKSSSGKCIKDLKLL